MNKALVAEIFESIQGEGRTVGQPVTFIRLWGCNLRCRFAGVECDTPYAVVREFDKAKYMTVNALVKQIKKLRPMHIVWTGGEPLMYQDYICEVMSALDYAYFTEVETNGTIAPTDELKPFINQFNVSVKLKSSNQLNSNYDIKRINHDVLKEFYWDNSYFKFVVTGKDDLKEIKEITKRHPYWDVYLMPEGFKREDVIKHSPAVVEMCLENGYKFSPREHIIIWDFKRGK